jgi:hypothetical protein
MTKLKVVPALVLAVSLAAVNGFAQSNTVALLAELAGLRSKIADPDTRTRVDAFHRAWSIALSTDSLDVKSSALDLMREAIASASDHIRIPAVYAIAEIANSTTDVQAKIKALAALHEPLQAGQVPIRDVAIDAVNSIVRPGSSTDLVMAALQALAEPVKSGNNTAPMDSEAAIGGIEVRMMAVAAVEEIGTNATEAGTKAKAMGLLQSYANKNSWEPEAKKRAADAASRIQTSIKKG